jgi:protein phosphatase methylesterase 1
MSSFAPWDRYWTRKYSVAVPGRGDFNAYAVDGPGEHLIVAIHGAGHSALSFSLVAQRLRGRVPLVALDLKCHGDSPGDEASDLAIDSLAADVAGFCAAVRPAGFRLVLLGHSLGGSVAARVAAQLRVSAVVAIDTIECTSLEALPQMEELLRQRPQAFACAQDAVGFVAVCGEMQNLDSAAVSAGGRFRAQDGLLVWRTDLERAKQHWDGWFRGFAEIFVRPENYKILLVPDINRLDTPFTIAHMSGKFQLEVCWDACHCVHEDNPKFVADMLIKLVDRLRKTRQWD